VKRITVLGNFSGRNAGDNAILGNLLQDVGAEFPDATFLVPTLNAAFVRRTFGNPRVRALGLMPWNGALKIFGLPTLYAMLATDLVLITDNLLFDRKFFNPTFNYLSTISMIAPWCKRRGIPIVLYNASVGPIETERGAAALRRVLAASPMAIVRDERSQQLLVEQKYMPAGEVVLAADCALNTVQVPDSRIEEMLAALERPDPERRLVGFNINAYIDGWRRGGGALGREAFVRLVAEAVDRLIEELGIDVVLFVTQVMDGKITDELVRALRHAANVRVVSNPTLSYWELAGLMSRLELLVGMRTHALILSASAGTPIVSINAYPKNQAFIETLGMGKWCIDFADFSAENLYKLVRSAWEQRAQLRSEIGISVALEKEKARSSAELLRPLLGESSSAP